MYIHDYLRSRGIWFEALLHQPASSSAKRARNARVTGRRVAKAVLMRVGNSFALPVLPASSRIDLERLSQVLGVSASEIRLATQDELVTMFPDCEPGVVPPFGQLYGLPTLVDSAFSEIGDIVVSGNTRHEGLWMHFRDFQALEGPEQASFSRPIAPEPRPSVPAGRDGNRRAG